MQVVLLQLFCMESQRNDVYDSWNHTCECGCGDVCNIFRNKQLL